MSEPFMSEIRIMAFSYAPKGWAMCNGQLLPINQNQALFSLLGTTYGGDGRVNFALPDLRARAPLHFGYSYTLGTRSGEETHTLSQSEMPQHVHDLQAVTSPGKLAAPGAASLAANRGGYSDAQGASLNPATVTNTGGSQPHENRPPYTVLNFCIALQGIFPSRN